jgi:hypothetical protein
LERIGQFFLMDICYTAPALEGGSPFDWQAAELARNMDDKDAYIA